MKNVKVTKQRLLEVLMENRLTHQRDFDIAWEAFRTKATENVQRILDTLKGAPHGKPVELWVNLTPPENHVEDYDRAVEMCQWEVGDEVVLSEAEFRQFVQDEWSWKGQFTTANKLYTGSESPSRIDLEGTTR
jgi:hypothetical protein